jgi:hypothetical protein
MGRGLSKMQRLILERAVKQQWVCNVDICEFYFHWPLALNYFNGELQNTLPRYSKAMPKSAKARVNQYLSGHPLDNTLTERVLPGSRSDPIFSRERIGRRRYHSGISSVSRAFRRLEERGLLEKEAPLGLLDRGHNVRWHITEKGLAAAKVYGLAKKLNWRSVEAKRTAWRDREYKIREKQWKDFLQFMSALLKR